MERKFIIDIQKINNYITQAQKKPNRTDWELTMFCLNCKKLRINWNLIIEINENSWEIKINWMTNIYEKFKFIPTWYKIDEKTKLYRQVKLAMSEAKNYWIYESVFKEI